MQGPSWNDIGALVIALVTLVAGSVAWAYGTFSLKADVSARLVSIETKLDCLINPKMCR